MATKIDQSTAMEAITKLKSTTPPQFLSSNTDLSTCSRIASQYLFQLLKPYTPKSPFDELLTVGFDAEQIWQQIDCQSQPLIASLKRDVKKFERNPNLISSIFGGDDDDNVANVELNGTEYEEDNDEDCFDDDDDDDDDEVEGEDDEEEEEEDEDEEDEDEDDYEDDGDGVPEVEDEFLKINDLEKFLQREEKKEYGGGEELKKKSKTTKKKGGSGGKNEDEDDEEEESESDDDLENTDVNNLLMFGGGDVDGGNEIRYEDFYLPDKKKMPKAGRKQVKKYDDFEMENEENVMPKRKQKQVEQSSESDEAESVDEDETQDKKNLSTHERERLKLEAKIKQMEEANLAAKDWTMQGEVTASKRPRDSALEVDLDFEHNLRPPPVITEEVTTSLEDMIKKRISEGHFDDVQKAPKLPSAAPKERKELDDNKSKKGLAEIYEEEYAKQTGIGTAPLSHNDELRNEASGLFKRLCLKLDALSHFHFAPKPVVDDMVIQTNVPALAMEEVASVAVSDAAMLAPEEVFAGKGDIKEDTELTKEDRKKIRASKKRKFKANDAARTANRPANKPVQNNGEGKEV